MARRMMSNFFLACLAVFLFVTFIAYFQSMPSEHATSDPYINVKDDSLVGAVDQVPGQAIPAPYEVADPKLPPPQYADPAVSQQPHQQAPPKSPDGAITGLHSVQAPVAPKDGGISNVKVGTVVNNPRLTFEVKEDIVYDPAGPRPDQVVLLMASDGKGHNGGIEHLMEMATQNRQEYADYHGYHYHFINISKFDIGNAHPVWAKLPAIIETFNTFPDAQWVWWLDMDAMIMSPEIDLNRHLLSHAALDSKIMRNQEFLLADNKKTGIFVSNDLKAKNIDIIVGQDHNGLNAGSFMLRRSKFTQLYIDFWSDPMFMVKEWPGKEQDTMVHLMMYHHVVREHLALVPQRSLNAYPVGWEHMGWKEGDLVIHLAGCWVDDACNQRWTDFWARRQTVAELRANGGIPKWGRTSTYAPIEATPTSQLLLQVPSSSAYSTPASVVPLTPETVAVGTVQIVQASSLTATSTASAGSIPVPQVATFSSDDLD